MFNDTVSPSGTVVNQPLGWKGIAISLERDTEYHSLIEYFAGSFVWYGAAREFIKLCEVTEGPVSKVRVLIEIKYNVTWDTLFDGKIDVSERENVSIAGTPYKYNAPIVRDDFWSRFISRRDTPVDLSASLDLDGNARTPITKIVLPLPSQKMDVSYRSTMFESGDTAREPIEFEMNFASNLRVFQLSLPIITKEGLENYWSIPAMVLVAPTPLTFGNEAPPNFTAKFKGSYTLDLSLFISTSPYSIPYGGGDQAPNLGLYIFKNGLFHANGTATNLGVNGTSGRTQFTYSDTFDLEVNESLTFYLYSGIGGDGVYFIVFNNWFAGEESYISLDGTTEFEDTETDAFLIKDAAESILSKIVGQDSVVSSTFFSTCKRLYAIMKLKHVRGYAFAEKAMFMTWNDWWKGAEPILNLGLGYSEVAGVKKIKIGSKEEFYNPTPIVFLNNVSGLTDTYDNTKHYNTITTGFETWSAESKSGIDDPQTKVTRAVPFFDTIGNKLDKLSKWYAASLGIESKRRLRVDLSKDDSLDETIAVIALKEDGADYLPEVGTDFASVGGLLNSDTRYNIRLTCGRIFKRWQKFIQGMLWFTSGLNFEFASGEGNYSVTSTLDDADCETDLGDQTLTESSAIAVDSNNYSYIPKQFKKARAPMAWETYKTIIANKENALGISAIDGSYLPMHIISLKFSLFKGYVDLTLLQASNSPVIPEGDYILMEDGNIILDENGDGILME
jgi:hypothetical protein